MKELDGTVRLRAIFCKHVGGCGAIEVDLSELTNRGGDELGEARWARRVAPGESALILFQNPDGEPVARDAVLRITCGGATTLFPVAAAAKAAHLTQTADFQVVVVPARPAARTVGGDAA